MAGITGQGGVEHAQHLGAALEPFCERERLTLRFAQTQVHRAQAAQGEKDILGTGGDRHQVDAGFEPWEPFRVGGDKAEQQVRMSR